MKLITFLISIFTALNVISRKLKKRNSSFTFPSSTINQPQHRGDCSGFAVLAALNLFCRPFIEQPITQEEAIDIVDSIKIRSHNLSKDAFTYGGLTMLITRFKNMQSDLSWKERVERSLPVVIDITWGDKIKKGLEHVVYVVGLKDGFLIARDQQNGHVLLYFNWKEGFLNKELSEGIWRQRHAKIDNIRFPKETSS